MNKPHSLVKRLKKEVIIETLKETTQVEYSTQKLEETVGGKQKKIDEENQLESQVQSLEDVAEIIEDDTTNTFDEDMNQEEGKCVLEQEHIPTDVHEERKEIPVPDKLRVDNTQRLKEVCEQKILFFFYNSSPSARNLCSNAVTKT